MEPLLPHLIAAPRLVRLAKFLQSTEEPMPSFAVELLNKAASREFFKISHHIGERFGGYDCVEMVLHDHPCVQSQLLVSAAVIERAHQDVTTGRGGENRQPADDRGCDKIRSIRIVYSVSATHNGTATKLDRGVSTAIWPIPGYSSPGRLGCNREPRLRLAANRATAFPHHDTDPATAGKGLAFPHLQFRAEGAGTRAATTHEKTLRPPRNGVSPKAWHSQTLSLGTRAGARCQKWYIRASPIDICVHLRELWFNPRVSSLASRSACLRDREIPGKK